MSIVLDKEYPVETKEQLVKSAQFFNKYLTRFRPEERVKIATIIDKQSQKLGVNFDYGWITNYARMFKGAAVSPDLHKGISLRKEAVRRHKVKINVDGAPVSPEEFLNSLEKKAQDQMDQPMAIIKSLMTFDKAAGIEYLYDREIPDPIFTVHGGLNNSEFDAVKVAGRMTQYDVIRATRNKDVVKEIGRVFGEKTASAFAKNPFQCIQKMNPPEISKLASIAKK